jgi:hypothetical protein
MKNTARINYPHLLPEDSALWSEFLDLFEPDHQTFLYDVAVGMGRDPGLDFDPSIRKMALQLSKRRIDAVGVSLDFVEIFEITQSAGLKACGQALVYPRLLKVTWDLPVPILVTIVCRSVQDDIDETLRAHDVRLIVIPSP